MAFASLGDLKVSIQDFMYGRTDLAPYCGDFVTLCEAGLNRVLRTRQQLTTETITLDSDGKGVIPADYLEFRQVTALTNPRRALELIAPSYSDNELPYRYAGFPAYFTIDGGTFTVLPNTTSDIEFTYYAKIPALTEDADTNWLLDKFPNIYLYGALNQACIFIGDDERAANMATMFGSFLEALIGDDRAAQYSRVRARVSGPTP